jgi:hypothetical protein
MVKVSEPFEWAAVDDKLVICWQHGDILLRALEKNEADYEQD